MTQFDFDGQVVPPGLHGAHATSFLHIADNLCINLAIAEKYVETSCALTQVGVRGESVRIASGRLARVTHTGRSGARPQLFSAGNWATLRAMARNWVVGGLALKLSAQEGHRWIRTYPGKRSSGGVPQRISAGVLVARLVCWRCSPGGDSGSSAARSARVARFGRWCLAEACRVAGGRSGRGGGPIRR